MISSDTVTLVFTGLSGIAAFAVWVYKKLIKPTQQFLDDQEDIKKAIKTIESEVVTNGGSSIKDAVNSLKRTCYNIERNQKVSDQRSKASLHYHEFPLFEVDNKGRIVWYNKEFSNIQDNEGDLKGYDWISMIAEEEREEFIKEFSSCVEMCRKLDIETVSMQGSEIHFVGHPYRVSEDDHEGFLIHLNKEK
tara:strand:- start:394 stop:969 length:576 start_codon:yes stop_codon:yes gene_type:complete